MERAHPICRVDVDPRLHLSQKGNDLGGFHQGEFMTREVTGTIDGDAVRIRSAYGEQHGDAVNLTFTGKVSGDQIGGALDMGEYLGATWTATRRDAGEPADGRIDEPAAASGGPGSGVAEQRRCWGCASRSPLPYPSRRSPHARRHRPQPEIRPAAPGRPRHRCAEQDQRRSRRRDCRRQNRRRRAPSSNPADAVKSVDVSGCTSRLDSIDIHAHVYAGTGERRSYAGDNSVYPDGFTLRVGVTTVADAGCAGWRNFEDFKQRVIDRSKTRILAFLNIVGNGMRGGTFEQDLADMEAKPTADMARRYPGSSSASRPRTTRDRSGRRSSARSKPERSRTCR